MLAEGPQCMPCYQGGTDGQEACATGRNDCCLVDAMIKGEELAARCPDGEDNDAQVIVLAHELLGEAAIAVPISRAMCLRYQLNPQGAGQAGKGNRVGGASPPLKRDEPEQRLIERKLWNVAVGFTPTNFDKKMGTDWRCEPVLKIHGKPSKGMSSPSFHRPGGNFVDPCIIFQAHVASAVSATVGSFWPWLATVVHGHVSMSMPKCTTLSSVVHM